MSNLAINNQASGIVQAPVFDRHTAIQRAVEQRNTMVEFVKAVMVDGVDYGKVPNTDKPTLFKPGAEKLCTLFNYLPRYEIVEKVEDWTGEHHKGEAFFFYHYRCLIADQSGQVIAAGEGSVNSWEKKYRYRDAKPVCPHCGQATVNKSTKDPGYYCWKKIGGCGATFADGDPQIISQPVGKVPNPDIFDQVNTMMKMSHKRALVAAILLACNASEFFSQDLEDMSVIDADIVTTSRPSKPLVIAPVQVVETATPASLMERLKQVEQWTGHTPAEVYSIAARKGINPDAMNEEGFTTLRNALFMAWGFNQGVFSVPTHAANAFKKMLSEHTYLAGGDDADMWMAWHTQILDRQRIEETGGAVKAEVVA